MYATRIMRMQAMRPLMMQGTRPLLLQTTRPMKKPVPKEDQSAHTVSQRLRSMKKIFPVEVTPLAFVLCVAVGFAVYSLGKKLLTDKQLRISRQNRSED